MFAWTSKTSVNVADARPDSRKRTISPLAICSGSKNSLKPQPKPRPPIPPNPVPDPLPQPGPIPIPTPPPTPGPRR